MTGTVKFRLDWRNPQHAYVSVFTGGDGDHLQLAGQLCFAAAVWDDIRKLLPRLDGFEGYRVLVEDFIEEANEQDEPTRVISRRKA